MIKPRIVSTCCDVLKCPRRGSVCSSRWTLRNGAKHDETIGEFNIKTNEIIIHIGDHNVMMVALLCCRLQLRIHLYINRIEYLSLSTGQTRQRVWLSGSSLFGQIIIFRQAQRGQLFNWNLIEFIGGLSSPLPLIISSRSNHLVLQESDLKP